MKTDPVVIVGAARTALADFQGGFASLSAASLGAAAIQAAVARAGLDPQRVGEVLMGCVLQAGQGQAPARQAALLAGLPLSAGCVTVNKVCGSAMQSIIFGHDSLLAESEQAVVVGGMESMSNAPYLLPKARGGYRLGHGQLFDHLFLDGLEDAYSAADRGRLMGSFADDCAAAYGLSRSAQDDFATRSYWRARQASDDGSFDWEITPVAVPGKRGVTQVVRDEAPFAVDLSRIADLKPAFRPDGTVTPANASSIADGAAALVLMPASAAEQQGLNPLARIVGHARYATEPAQYPLAPVPAIRQLLAKIGWTTATVDLYEINEAFAVVALLALRELGLDAERVNIHGGACALGHPIGATGARLVVTLLGALQKYKLKRGIASVCIGGGEALALAVELF